MNSIRQLAAPILVGITAFSPALPAFADEETYKIGVEGFSDNYKEPDTGIDVNSRATYGSATASYTYSWTNYLATVEARGSYGHDNYKSPSGTASGIPQYETEERLLGGMKLPIDKGYVFVPYFGVGTRYFFDNGKGHITNAAVPAALYDRRIWQFYIPIGASMQITDDGWNYTPSLEFDQLLYGRVKSRLGEVAGYYNISNSQMMSGYGVRGELMVGQQYKDFGWEAGPFFRYWSIQASKTTFDPLGTPWVEPYNSRLQTGAAVRVNF